MSGSLSAAEQETMLALCGAIERGEHGELAQTLLAACHQEDGRRRAEIDLLTRKLETARGYLIAIRNAVDAGRDTPGRMRGLAVEALDATAIAPDAPEPVAPLGCFDCGLRYGTDDWLDVSLPHDQWMRISPRASGGGILCANCIVKRASKLDGVVNLFARIAFQSDHDEIAAQFQPPVEVPDAL